MEQVERLLEVDDFSMYVPGTERTGFSIMKSEDGSNIEDTRPIGGYCSTESLDRQSEVVVAKGLDFSEFVAWGWFNDNHKQGTSEILGYPRLARLEKGNRWWTEGNLLFGYPEADRVWNLAKALRRSGAPRKLGFSIEGKVVERDRGNRIVRALVRNVAITNSPVNTDCSWDIVSKAFAPISVVEQAQKRRVASPLDRLVRSTTCSFDDAVDKLKQLRPHLSKSTRERIVRLSMSR